MKTSAGVRAAIRRSAAVGLLTSVALFGSAGTVAWWNGWAFVAVLVAIVAALTGKLFEESPDLLEERRNAAKKAKAWDRILVPVMAGVLPFLSIVLAGLDRRFAWTQSLTPVESILALIVAIGSSAFTYWAMSSNRFFSSHVRIQTDRGHTVVRTGPYRYVRHPGYAGAIAYNLAVPILLGSLAAFWVGVAFVVLSVVRTVLEDRTLRNELDGYREYAASVQYRLVPFVW